MGEDFLESAAGRLGGSRMGEDSVPSVLGK